MYAVVKTGGKQHVVNEGDELLIEHIPGEAGDSVELKDVVLLGGEGKTVADKAALAKMKVHATIVEQLKDKKVLVFKYKPKKRYRRKKGHRQMVTRVSIDLIDDGSGKVKAKAAKPAPKAKAASKPAAKAKESAKPAAKAKEAPKTATKPKAPAKSKTAAKPAEPKAKAQTEARTAKTSAKKPAAKTEKPPGRSEGASAKDEAKSKKTSGGKGKK